MSITNKQEIKLKCYVTINAQIFAKSFNLKQKFLKFCISFLLF